MNSFTISHVLPCSIHRVHTEWQCPISGVHSIMMEQSALAGEGVGCTPTPFTLFTNTHTHTHKVAVYAPAERADTRLLFHLYPICTLLFNILEMYESLSTYEYSICTRTMDEGTIKTPISKCRLYWCFCLRWSSNFVGS
jgi:hypothetical protein